MVVLVRFSSARPKLEELGSSDGLFWLDQWRIRRGDLRQGVPGRNMAKWVELICSGYGTGTDVKLILGVGS